MSNSSGPKSFKDMMFPPSRDGGNAVYAPLPPAPSPKTISVNEMQRRADQLKEMKKFINSETCPLCSAQLDGAIGYDQATVYCRAFGEDEYQVSYKFGLPIPYWSRATLYTTHFAYEIFSQHIVDTLYRNTIYKIDLSLNKKFRRKEMKSILNYEGERLLLEKSTNEEKLLSKINLYTLFS